MRIKLDKVSNFRKEGKWGKVDVEYTRDGGKATKRTLVAIGPTKDIIEQFRVDGAVGADWEIELETVEKDGQTYYNWMKATKLDPQEAASSPASAYKAKSTYETPEERAKKNVFIARQNALTNAVSFMAYRNPKASPEDVVKVAETFVCFTLDSPFNPTTTPVTAEAGPNVGSGNLGDDDIPWEK